MRSLVQGKALDSLQVVGLNYLNVTVSLTSQDGVVVQLVEAVDNGGASDVLHSLQCVHFKYIEVIVRATNEKLKTLHEEAEHCVAISLQTANEGQVVLLKHIHIVLQAIYEDIVLLSHHCKGVLAADGVLCSSIHPGRVSLAIEDCLSYALVLLVRHLVVLVSVVSVYLLKQLTSKETIRNALLNCVLLHLLNHVC